MEGKSDNDDNVSPPKQPKTDSSFQSAFSGLKKSEFFEEPVPGSSKASDSSKFNTLLVNLKQKGNPLLKSLSNIPWEFSEIVPDYVMGKTSCALFLSIRYHQLNPDYIHERLKALGNMYNLRVLLVQVDVADPHHALKHLTRVCILADLTLMLAWSAEDAGKIIETYKIYENKPPDAIMDRSDTAPYQKLVSALTTIRSVNKTDATTLLSTFGTLGELIKTKPNTLALCPGIGIQKAERIHKTLHEPFLRPSRSVTH
ncbi:DNA excision repair protein ERCC-1 [Hylaeus volcanicus]|uniref:DNA excision repair protein ERCC-1 n=1 Tax=Hylaeus volcanicus TaxID=313075 RepID=UPI0023B77A38|nr:DNA excision repair protein ERCC-1 [Hylaeus volcanicus]XP_053978091.1 DNA excision repair protein ERCC-1 [Hylaeus volcanicus]XP_053978092.1 DNA excision repair protein ERCC-1 [Hylaeus volcanicus]XP_053978093.1 DNA excision repair protein ERCC-1 [Hylaeus volcanicus]